jgi:two-component system phosphate regulon response regulator OmpR
VVDARSIDSLVSRLRRKLEADPARPRYLQTVWGAGYRFAESDA